MSYVSSVTEESFIVDMYVVRSFMGSFNLCFTGRLVAESELLLQFCAIILYVSSFLMWNLFTWPEN